MNIGGSFGGDTGDSFLAQVDSYMGAPSLKGGKGGGGSDGGGGSLLQGLAKALGIGNKDIKGKMPDGAGDAIQVETGTAPSAANAGLPALAIAPSAESSANAAASSGDLLASIFRTVSGVNLA